MTEEKSEITRNSDLLELGVDEFEVSVSSKPKKSEKKSKKKQTLFWESKTLYSPCNKV